MKLVWDILKRLFVWIFPVLLFDGCLNRDPYLKIDECYSIAAVSGSQPRVLMYNDPHWRSAREDKKRLDQAGLSQRSNGAFESFRWNLENVTDCELSEAAIIGNSDEGFFIADRHTGKLQLFSSSHDRDQAVQVTYQASPKMGFYPPSELMWMKSRFLWPWFHVYYAACLVLIPLLKLREAMVPPRMRRGP